MGDIGTAISGGLNSVASIYSADKYREGVRETNNVNIGMNRENNQFNAEQAELAYQRNSQLQSNEFGFNAAQADLNRSFQSDEAEKARQWQEDFYHANQSPEALARQYQALGISPAAVLSGSGGSVASTSLPSGSQASGSSGSTPSASAASFSGAVAPDMVENPISAFLEAYQSSQRTQAEVNKIKADTEYQNTLNQYAAKKEIMSLKESRARLKETLSRKDLNDEERKVKERDYELLGLEIQVRQATIEDSIQMTKQERREKEETVKGLILDNARKTIENEWTPKLLASQYNLNNSQAKAVIMSAQAALSQASTAKYNAKTHRLEYLFDRTKFQQVMRDNILANTRLMNAEAEGNENINSTFTQRMVIDLTKDCLGSAEDMLWKVVFGLGLGKLVTTGKGVKGTGSKPYQSPETFSRSASENWIP